MVARLGYEVQQERAFRFTIDQEETDEMQKSLSKRSCFERRWAFTGAGSDTLLPVCCDVKVSQVEEGREWYCL